MINFSKGPLQNFLGRLSGNGAGRPPRDKKYSEAQQEAQQTLLRRFRPPPGEWLLLGLAGLTIQGCVLWGAMAMFSLVDLNWVVPGTALYQVLLLGVVYLAAFYRGRNLAERDRNESLWVRLLGLLIMVVLVRFGPYLFNLEELSYDLRTWQTQTGRILTPAFGVLLVLTLWSAQSGERRGRELLTLYVRPHELPVERGGAGLGVTVSLDRQKAYRDLKTHLVFGGFLLAFSIAALVIIFQREVGNAVAGTLIGLLLAYVVVTLGFLSWIRLRYLRTIWQLGELTEPATLRSRWTTYFLALALLVTLLALVLPRTGNLSRPDWNLNLGGGKGDQQLPGDRLPTPDAQFQPAQPPPRRPDFQTPDWLGPLLFWLAVAVAVGVIFYLLRRVAWRKIKWPSFKLALPNFVKMLQDFWAWLLGFFRRKPRLPRETVEDVAGAKRSWWNRWSRESLPTDPRGQVRYHYRQTLRRAKQAGVPRQPPQTPQEYAGYLQDRLIEPAQPSPTDSRQDVDRLRAAYEEARFSLHPISPDVALDAAERASRLGGALRQVRRGPRKKD